MLPTVTTPLLGAGAKRRAQLPTLTTPPFDLSFHRHATNPPYATHVIPKTTSEGLQAADMGLGRGLTVKLSGPRQRGALAAMRMIDSQRIAAKVPCWCGSARAKG